MTVKSYVGWRFALFVDVAMAVLITVFKLITKLLATNNLFKGWISFPKPVLHQIKQQTDILGTLES